MKAPAILKKLDAYKKAGLLDIIDVQFAHFLFSLDPSASDEVLLAGCLTSHAYQQGNICFPLKEYALKVLFESANKSLPVLEAPSLSFWKQKLEESPLVGNSKAFKPLILDEKGRLYLHKLFHQEQNLANAITQKATLENYDIDTTLLKEGLERLFPPQPEGGSTNWQKVAAAIAVLQKMAIISGGPGTGKTTTVVRVLALLLEQYGHAGLPEPEIALAAPTGKASARLQDSIVRQKKTMQAEKEIINRIPSEVVTLHKLLGARRHDDTFLYHRTHPLPHDVVIVDEASMVDQALMNHLFEAMKPSARFILLGDKDQLASVEAGSVFGDICSGGGNLFSPSLKERLNSLNLKMPDMPENTANYMLNDHIVLLKHSYRFSADSGIAQFSNAVREGRPEMALALLKDAPYLGLKWLEESTGDVFWDKIKPFILSFGKRIQATSSPRQALDLLQTFKILCAHRRGRYGVERFNQKVEELLWREKIIRSANRWYHGKPIIIHSNDYQLQLKNGDIGICLEDEESRQMVYFAGENQTIKKIHPARLPQYETAYALTIHKSQGSEFDDVLLVLPEITSKVLSRELFYTAVTRARHNIWIAGSTSVLTKAVKHKIARNSGLRDRLWE